MVDIDQPFREAVLPRRAWRNRRGADAHGSLSAHDSSAIDPIPVTDQVARGFSHGAANPQTPSGSPEVTVRNVKPERVKSAVINTVLNRGNTALNRGLRVKTDSGNTVVLERPTTNVVAGVLLSTQMSGSPVDRITFTVTDVPEGTRVVLR